MKVLRSELYKNILESKIITIPFCNDIDVLILGYITIKK